MTQQTPPGWYPDPLGQPGSLRWWDGTTWTDSTQSDHTAAASADEHQADAWSGEATGYPTTDPGGYSYPTTGTESEYGAYPGYQQPADGYPGQPAAGQDQTGQWDAYPQTGSYPATGEYTGSYPAADTAGYAPETGTYPAFGGMDTGAHDLYQTGSYQQPADGYPGQPAAGQDQTGQWDAYPQTGSYPATGEYQSGYQDGQEYQTSGYPSVSYPTEQPETGSYQYADQDGYRADGLGDYGYQQTEQWQPEATGYQAGYESEPTGYLPAAEAPSATSAFTGVPAEQYPHQQYGEAVPEETGQPDYPEATDDESGHLPPPPPPAPGATDQAGARMRTILMVSGGVLGLAGLITGLVLWFTRAGAGDPTTMTDASTRVSLTVPGGWQIEPGKQETRAYWNKHPCPQDAKSSCADGSVYILNLSSQSLDEVVSSMRNTVNTLATKNKAKLTQLKAEGGLVGGHPSKSFRVLEGSGEGSVHTHVLVVELRKVASVTQLYGVVYVRTVDSALPQQTIDELLSTVKIGQQPSPAPSVSASPSASPSASGG